MFLNICRKTTAVSGLGLILALAQLAGCGQSPPFAGSSAGNPAGYSRTSAGVGHYDLGRDEDRGGHTLFKHVGRSDAQLSERLARERNISAASTWTDRETAEETVAAALSAERSRVENWKARGFPRANLALHYDASRSIGRSLRRDDARTVECTEAVIVLRADGPDSFYVLTTYPEARE